VCVCVVCVAKMIMEANLAEELPIELEDFGPHRIDVALAFKDGIQVLPVVAATPQSAPTTPHTHHRTRTHMCGDSGCCVNTHRWEGLESLRDDAGGGRRSRLARVEAHQPLELGCVRALRPPPTPPPPRRRRSFASECE
jgi:hypothetical protein